MKEWKRFIREDQIDQKVFNNSKAVESMENL